MTRTDIEIQKITDLILGAIEAGKLTHFKFKKVVTVKYDSAEDHDTEVKTEWFHDDEGVYPFADGSEDYACNLLNNLNEEENSLIVEVIPKALATSINSMWKEKNTIFERE